MQISIRSFGCSTNQADSEAIAGCLTKAGYKITKNQNTANILIYNTCAVKGPTENKIIASLKKTPPNKKIIITGCLPMINFERIQKEVTYDAIIGPAPATKIIDVVKDVLNGKKILNIKESINAQPPLTLPTLPFNPIISIIPINYGCLGSCSYCCVTQARGKLRSYSISEILLRIKNDLNIGKKEFWLTSQDTACYGKDINTNLLELLEKIIEIKNNFKIRLGMMTPNLTYPIMDNLLLLFQNPKIYQFIHLPLQSGDDYILQKMQRNYTTKQFKKIVQKIRQKLPYSTLSTDIICGFPGETPQAFQNTLNLLSELKPDIINVSKFFARPNTPAIKMKTEFVEQNEIKKRTTNLSKIAKQISYKKNKQWLNWAGQIIINEHGKTQDTWVGRNFAYKPIVIKNPKNLMGQTIHVKVEKTFPTYLLGKLN